MKAQRRHELQTNTLAQVLNDLPLYLRFHANKILIGVIILCLIVLLVRSRIGAARDAAKLVATGLDTASVQIQQLRTVDQTQPTDIARISERKNLAEMALSNIDQVVEGVSGASSAPTLSRAGVLRGDLYWALASLRPLPGASTQPSLAMPQTREEYLEKASAEYQKVLNDYDDQHVSKAAAAFGLAAIAEDRAEWDKAGAYYGAVTADAQMPKLFKDMAQMRTAVLARLREPIYIGRYSSTLPSTLPTTNESTEAQAAAPTSSPSPTTTSQ